jgi:hypothetical protein
MTLVMTETTNKFSSSKYNTTLAKPSSLPTTTFSSKTKKDSSPIQNLIEISQLRYLPFIASKVFKLVGLV